jgi:hypothetical protein
LVTLRAPEIPPESREGIVRPATHPATWQSSDSGDVGSFSGFGVDYETELLARIARLTDPGVRKLAVPKTTLYYEQKRLKEETPLRVYWKMARRLRLV